MISSIAIKDNGEVKQDIPIREYKKFISNEKRYLWVDIENPTEDELTILKDIFEFHPLTIEDVHRVVELPKIDDYGAYLFVVFHKIELTRKDTLKPKEINFFLGRNYVVSIHRDSKDVFKRINSKIYEDKQFLKNGPEYIMHTVMDEVIDGYFPILDHFDEDITKIEEQITKGKTENILKKIIKIKRQFSTFRKSLNPQRDIISKLASNHYQIISEKAQWYFKDIYDHIFRIYSTLESYNDMITVVFDAYLSNISISLTESSNKLNKVMQKLTLVSTIFLPLTFIASVYGMNFEHMPELEWKYSYYIVLLVMVVIAFLMTYIFRRKKLL
ncbi:MAG: magnesium/cobalt transporter CorA [Nanobdellota archaeon]